MIAEPAGSGQIVLSRDLDRAGTFPPVDVLPSLSRVMNAGIGEGHTFVHHRAWSDQLYAVYARGRDARFTASIVGEAGLSGADRRALEFARREGQRDPDGSRKALARALSVTPGNHELLTAISQLDLRTGHADRAMRRLDEVIESQLAGPHILLLRAEILARTGELDRAEADALRAFEAAPELPGTIDLLFAIYQAQGKLADTQRSFEEAESVGVLHAGARVLLGRLYLAQGDVDRAKEMYEKVLAEDPELASAKNDLAFLLAREGSDLDRALALAEDAQRSLPEHPSIADTVGFTYYRMKQNEAALQQFRYAIQLSEARRGESPPGYHYHLGLALAELHRDEEAAAAFERALAIDPEFAESSDARRRLEATRKTETLSSNPT